MDEKPEKSKMEGDRPPCKNINTIEKFLMITVKDHTKTIKPHCLVNTIKSPSRIIIGSYQASITLWK